jgi:tRNA/tmRNA/rRNA uracil-C5-methylase (TrmA/RlmC/RlmD family)
VVEVELREVKKNFARANLLRVLTPAPDRVEPACRHFAACGGCQYQHLAYEVQLRIKHKQVADLFQRIGDIDPALVGNRQVIGRMGRNAGWNGSVTANSKGQSVTPRGRRGGVA